MREKGESFDIFYSNSNIAPAEEYERRFGTLSEWALSEDIAVTEGNYDHDEWKRLCRTPFESGEISREERCRRCYGLRFKEAAEFASENGYGAMSTTLSVSPYQYTDVIRQELERACDDAGIECVFEDFRPYYDEATRRSRDAGMYRQKYCGCELSLAEAEQEREERRAERERLKEARRKERAEAEDEKRREMEKRKLERRQYDEERARRKAILKDLRSKKAE